jgi:phosphoglycolate phosphatase
MPQFAPGINALLFDKDGTLLDYHASWAPINRASAAFAAAGDRALERRLLLIGGLDEATRRYGAGSLLAAGNAGEIAAAWVAAGSPHAVARLTGELDRIFKEGVPGAVPVTPLEPYFRDLRARGFKLGIASSDGGPAIHATAAHFGFAGHVDFIAGYDSGHGHKPGPGMVLAFARAIGLPVSRIAVVGDNLHDIRMGKSAGCGLTVGVLTGTSPRAVLAPEADTVLDDIVAFSSALPPRAPG